MVVAGPARESAVRFSWTARRSRRSDSLDGEVLLGCLVVEPSGGIGSGQSQMDEQTRARSITLRLVKPQVRSSALARSAAMSLCRAAAISTAGISFAGLLALPRPHRSRPRTRAWQGTQIVNGERRAHCGTTASGGITSCRATELRVQDHHILVQSGPRARSLPFRCQRGRRRDSPRW